MDNIKYHIKGKNVKKISAKSDIKSVTKYIHKLEWSLVITGYLIIK